MSTTFVNKHLCSNVRVVMCHRNKNEKIKNDEHVFDKSYTKLYNLIK